MIKTLVCRDHHKLDEAVNEFMHSKGRSLAVRTENFVLHDYKTSTDVVFHKAVIFYD